MRELWLVIAFSGCASAPQSHADPEVADASTTIGRWQWFAAQESVLHAG